MSHTVLDDLKYLVEDRIEKKRVIDRPHLAEKISLALNMNPAALADSHEPVLRAVLQDVADRARSQAYDVEQPVASPDEHPAFQAAAGAELLGLSGEDGPNFEALKDDYCRHVRRTWGDLENDPENRTGPGRVRRLRAAIWIKQSGRRVYDRRRVWLTSFESAIDDYLAQLTDADREQLRAKELHGKPAHAPTVQLGSREIAKEPKNSGYLDSSTALLKTQREPRKQGIDEAIHVKAQKPLGRHTVIDLASGASNSSQLAIRSDMQALATVVSTRLTEEMNWQENSDPFRLRIRWSVAPGEFRAPWHTAHGDTAISDPIPLAEFDDITSAYLAVPSGRLVILGQGGAGKSTLAMELARSLLTQDRWQELGLLPVVVKLAAWEPDRRSLDEWVFDQAAAEYPGWAEATNLESFHHALMDKSIVPILDGFDEVDLRHRSEVLTQIGTTLSRLVLLSRYDDYASAERFGGRIVPRAAAIVLRDLRFGEIEEYLQLTIGSAAQSDNNREKWAPVITAVRDSGSEDEPATRLSNFVTTPLAASLIRTIYSETDADPSELLTEDMTATRKQLLMHLSSRFVRARYELHFRDILPTSRVTNRAIKASQWLSYIAARTYVNDIFGMMFEHTPSRTLGWLSIRARIALVRNRLVRLATFLNEAHQCGILRWNGYTYEFRHAIILDGLAQAYLVSTSPSRRHRQDRFLIERNMLIAQWRQGDGEESIAEKLEDMALEQYKFGNYLDFVNTINFVHGCHLFSDEHAKAISVLHAARSLMLKTYKDYLSDVRRFNGSRMVSVRYAMIVAWNNFVDALMMYGLEDKALTQQRVLLRIVKRSWGAYQVGDVADVKRRLLRLESKRKYGDGKPR